MAVRFHSLIAVGVTALLAGGCSMFSFGRDAPQSIAPPPLGAAPAGTVTGETLPPPGAVAPAQPSGLAALDPSLQTAAVQPAPPPMASGELGRTDLLGGWTISTATDSCQLFMTLTTWAGGYRASTRNCVSPGLQTVSAWNMEGSQVQLLNDAGITVARLYPSSKTQFTGQTEGGGPISVSR
jgi:Protease inhibitor Inh